MEQRPRMSYLEGMDDEHAHPMEAPGPILLVISLVAIVLLAALMGIDLWSSMTR
jgi:hypothetical protein